jgi:hypothetical protein
MESLFSVFRKYPDESAIVGRLLSGYSILEIDLMHCVSQVRDDLDTVLKAMFRNRGETSRINVADAFGRHYYHKHSLRSEFETAIGAVRYCLKIRNQYAHSIWWDYSGRLAFAAIEDVAKLNTLVTDLGNLDPLCVDLLLLQQQEAYFNCTDDLLNYVNFEGRQRAGKIVNTRPKPKQPILPPLHISCT